LKPIESFRLIVQPFSEATFLQSAQLGIASDYSLALVPESDGAIFCGLEILLSTLPLLRPLAVCKGNGLFWEGRIQMLTALVAS
jgi:hypothetical protein